MWIAISQNDGALNYNTIKEGVYANLALNKIIFGSLNLNNLEIDVSTEYLIQDHVIMNIFGNLIVYLGLKFF